MLWYSNGTDKNTDGDCVRGTYSVALDTTLSVLLLVARHTHRLLVTWYERLNADWLTTNFAAEAFLVKLFAFKLIFLHPFNSDILSSIKKLIIIPIQFRHNILLLFFNCLI